MVSKAVAIALAFASITSAAPTLKRRDDCQKAYDTCIAAGTAQVACSCTLTACLGEDDARNREYCSSATASLVSSSTIGIPGGCNPAHPGSCPSTYFTYPTETPTATVQSSSISGIPGGCNPAHPGSCPSSYFTYTTETVAETFTSIAGIPGGCNPAHPGSCPSSYFTYQTASTTAQLASATAKADTPGYQNPSPVQGVTWSLENLTRYCGEDDSGCDYNFVIKAGDKTERCTVIRMPGSNAAVESWSDEPCTEGSDFKVSWGYVTDPAPAFAVITLVDGKRLAWFGVSNVNEQPVSLSSPYGSGQYGNLGPEQVYTY